MATLCGRAGGGPPVSAVPVRDSVLIIVPTEVNALAEAKRPRDICRLTLMNNCTVF